MTTLTISSAKLTDLPEIIQLENSKWNEQQRCSPDNLLRRLNNFQEGFLVGRSNNKIVASFYAIRRMHSPGEPINWLLDSGNGTGSTHDKNGESLFSISITVSSSAPKGSYREMMEAWRNLAKQQKVNLIYAGSRVPGLNKFNGHAEDYLLKVKSGEIFDHTLSKAKYCGFCIGNLIHDYFHDPDSLNYGVEIFQLI